MSSVKDPLIFMRHVKASIDKINSFVKGFTKEEFMKDELRKSAVVREIEVIGEAVKNTPHAFLSKYPGTDWKSIAGTRDKIIHHYFGVDYEIVWSIVKDDLPELDKVITQMLSDSK